MHSLEFKNIDFDVDLTEVCPQRSNHQYSSIGSDNGLAPARRQAIIWSDDGQFTDAYMRHSASMRHRRHQHLPLELYERGSREVASDGVSLQAVWAPSQYPKRRLFLRSRKVSKPRDCYFQLSYRFEIWQAHRQHCCRSACQISERSENSKYKSRGFEALRDLTEIRLFGYWDGALVVSGTIKISRQTPVWLFSRVRVFLSKNHRRNGRPLSRFLPQMASHPMRNSYQHTA